MLNQVSYLNKERKRKKNYINFSKKFVERERERERERGFSINRNLG